MDPRTSEPPLLAASLERAAALHPERIAVEAPDGSALRYGQLEAAASRMAQHLYRAGVRSGDRVALLLPKSLASIVTVLGILKARGAYVPLDFAAPFERNRHILEDCKPRMICTRQEDGERLADLGTDLPQLVLPAPWPGEAETSWPPETDATWRTPEPARDEDLAYLLYTSGSTGRPKGVVHTQASATSFVDWAFREVAPTGSDRFSSHAPLHFDLSIFDLHVCLRAGATLVLVDEALASQPRQLAAFIAQREISIWYSVPSILAMLARHGKLTEQPSDGLRVVIFAGEVFPIEPLKHLQSLWPDRTYYNFYGPTETNVCTAYRLPCPLPSSQTRPVPIGPACDNVRTQVLDERQRPVARGETGLLYVHASGPTMRGYWKGEHPPPDPFHVDETGERWYGTGDLVREEDGGYVYVGRRDRMVKRRGYRIELGEIENALHLHDQVAELAAVASQASSGELEIVAFLVPKAPQTKLSPLALKQFCMQALPSYMCPDRFESLDALPRTATDKVDLQELVRRCDSGSAS